jgi:hypothetical protein
MTKKERAVLDLIKTYGGFDGSHHKQWLLNEIVQKLTGNGYSEWVKNYQKRENGQEIYEWNTGIAP